ncbi:hypothetical protein [Aquimarina sp. 2201CG5-10]|uniref:hypothetical protein n=1 Tax=Aquimarina callyspongiae TaxID=3098150 RepID=UPI002AB41D9B|nr:hypothetical protein [Aquimarina sp. 2201CG5-10]MDY8137102.1 hypothetical protein [Aquimarina sp. 2201CG5-10]
MKLFLFLTLVSLFFIGCKKENTTTIQQDVPIVSLDSLSKEKIDLNLLKLSSDAEKDLESFEDFQNLKKLMQTLRKANPYYIRKYADSMDVLIQTTEENLSKDLKVNTITSRLVVLSTESGLLKQLAEKKHPKAEKLMDANTLLITAYNSLIIQLNELSLAIPENIEKELLRDNENLRDSINSPQLNIEN